MSEYSPHNGPLKSMTKYSAMLALKAEITRLPQSLGCPEKLSRGMLNIDLADIAKAMMGNNFEKPPLLSCHALRTAWNEIQESGDNDYRPLFEITRKIVNSAVADPYNHCKQTTEGTFCHASSGERLETVQQRSLAPGILFNCNTQGIHQMGFSGTHRPAEVILREDMLSFGKSHHDPLLRRSYGCAEIHAADWANDRLLDELPIDKLKKFSISTFMIENPRGTSMPYWREVEFNFPAFVPDDDITAVLYSFDAEPRVFSENILGISANHVWLVPESSHNIGIYLTEIGTEKTHDITPISSQTARVGSIVHIDGTLELKSSFKEEVLQEHLENSRPRLNWVPQ